MGLLVGTACDHHKVRENLNRMRTEYLIGRIGYPSLCSSSSSSSSR